MRWAKIEDGIVTQVTVSSVRKYGAEWLSDNLGGEWLEIPKSAIVGPGYSYRSDIQRYIPPQPLDGWILDEASLTWIDPPPPEIVDAPAS
mgnify:CR=1 FL=1